MPRSHCLAGAGGGIGPGTRGVLYGNLDFFGRQPLEAFHPWPDASTGSSAPWMAYLETFGIQGIHRHGIMQIVKPDDEKCVQNTSLR